MDSNQQTVSNPQNQQTPATQQEADLSFLKPILKLLACGSIVYAPWEYLHWINHQEGIISEWVNFPFTFTAHPFIILWFLILGAFIPNYFHDFIQKRIAQSGYLVREKAYKTAEIAKFFYIIFLVAVSFYSYNYIQGNVSEGICNNFFTCSAAFTLEKVHGIFALIYFVILQFGFFINNLPQTQSIPFSDRGIVVLDKEEGLYGLQPGQFVFIHTLGENTKYDIFPSNYRAIKGYRLYKSLRQRWFVVSEDFFYLKNDRLIVNLDLWKLECRYEARICDRNIIDRNQINFSILESLDQLQSKIEADCIIKFREKITSEFLYQRANQELISLYAKSKTNNQSLQALSSTIGQLIRALINVKELGSNLVNQSRYTIYLYGKLFEVSFQVQDIAIIEREEARIDDFLSLIQKESEGLNEKLKLLIKALQKAEGYIDREDITKIMNFLMETTGIYNFEKERIQPNTLHKKETNSNYQDDSNFYYDI